MSQKNTYRSFCATAPADFPVFMQDWYLDVVCGPDQWDAIVIEKGGRVLALWPYALKKTFWWEYIVMPPLARFQGPWLQAEYRKPKKEISLLKSLLEQLPRLDAFEQDWNYTASNWLPWYWAGYTQSVRYSYVLSLADMALVWNNLEPDYRNQKIPKASARVRLESDVALSDFIQVHHKSYARQGLATPVPDALLARLDKALAARGQRKILGAIDLETGALHAVAYLIWDRERAYYLMAGDDPDLRDSGAGIWLAWEAIQYSSRELKVPFFDFVGSMVPAIERVRRQFGAEQQLYFRVSKTRSWWMKLWRKLR